MIITDQKIAHSPDVPMSGQAIPVPIRTLPIKKKNTRPSSEKRESHREARRNPIKQGTQRYLKYGKRIKESTSKDTKIFSIEMKVSHEIRRYDRH